MNLRNLQEGSGGDCLNREGTPVIFGDRPHPILPDGVDDVTVELDSHPNVESSRLEP